MLEKQPRQRRTIISRETIVEILKTLSNSEKLTGAYRSRMSPNAYRKASKEELLVIKSLLDCYTISSGGGTNGQLHELITTTVICRMMLMKLNIMGPASPFPPFVITATDASGTRLLLDDLKLSLTEIDGATVTVSGHKNRLVLPIELNRKYFVSRVDED